jgi:hypothetical protein
MSNSKWSNLKYDDDDDDEWTPVARTNRTGGSHLGEAQGQTPRGGGAGSDMPAPIAVPITSSIESIDSSEPFADMPIPTGPWTIYYHPHFEIEKDFTSIDKFKIGKTVETFAEFWAVWDEIGDDTLLDGYFYIMKDGYLPIWEDPKNVDGGTYTIRIQRDAVRSKENDPVKIYYTYAIATMLGQLAKDPDNIIKGVRISNKNSFKKKANIIHIWNHNSMIFNNSDNIRLYHRPNPGDEVRYEANCNKRYN